MIKILALTLLLSGCADFGPYTYAAIEKKKEYSDTEAAVFSQGPCAMTVGALLRNFPPEKRAAILYLCEPDNE